MTKKATISLASAAFAIILGGTVAASYVASKQHTAQPSLPADESALRKMGDDAEKEWRRRYSNVHPRAQIESISQEGHVKTLIYLPHLEGGSVWLRVNGKRVMPSYAGQKGPKLGTSYFTFSLPLQQYKNGIYKVEVIDSSTGDIDSMKVSIQNGAVQVVK